MSPDPWPLWFRTEVLMLASQSCLTLCDPTACQAPLSVGFSGKNTGVGCHALLQRIFLTWGLNPVLPHCRQILYCPSWIRLSNAEGQRGWAPGCFSLRCRWRWWEVLKGMVPFVRHQHLVCSGATNGRSSCHFWRLLPLEEERSSSPGWCSGCLWVFSRPNPECQPRVLVPGIRTQELTACQSSREISVSEHGLWSQEVLALTLGPCSVPLLKILNLSESRYTHG